MLHSSQTSSQSSGWKPRAYRKRPGDGVDEKETGREAMEEGSKSDRETSNEEEDSDTTVNEREKIVVDEEDDGDSIDDVDANEVCYTLSLYCFQTCYCYIGLGGYFAPIDRPSV